MGSFFRMFTERFFWGTNNGSSMALLQNTLLQPLFFKSVTKVYSEKPIISTCGQTHLTIRISVCFSKLELFKGLTVLAVQKLLNDIHINTCFRHR